jgi:predicted Zn-dependent protease
MAHRVQIFKGFFKSLLIGAGLCTLAWSLAGCSVNPATGRQQFDGLMPASQEASIGASEHKKILQQYGGLYNNQAVQNYVDRVGQSLVPHTERRDVRYQFFVLDSPIVNAFALPGGYIYISRGLLAVANSEAELAGVLGHEIGHITGRHQAARYSQGVLTSLGATVLSATLGTPGLNQAIGLGSNLYMSSYSRSQETEADNLGIRYLNRANYDVFAMSDFLMAMSNYLKVEGQATGKGSPRFSYLSTHPDPAPRAAAAAKEAMKYSNDKGGHNREAYLKMISGLSYGDSYDQGFARDNTFYHPKLGFKFSAPSGYEFLNQPNQVVAAGDDGSAIILDLARNTSGLDPVGFMAQDWLKGRLRSTPESITINGFPAATTAFEGSLNGRPMLVRLIAIQWSPSEMFRFQVAMPQNLSSASVENLKRATYSFQRMTESEKQQIRPQQVRLVTARAGDTLESLAGRMNVDRMKVERFRALNNVTTNLIEAGRTYKIIQ